MQQMFSQAKWQSGGSDDWLGLPLIKTEVADQSCAIALSPQSPFSSRGPSLQSQGNIMYNLLIALDQSSGELSATVYPVSV